MSSDKGDRRGDLAAESETEMTVITPPSDANHEVFGCAHIDLFSFHMRRIPYSVEKTLIVYW